MERRRFRKIVFRIHMWLGLHFCLLLGLIFVTGILLLFSPELSYLPRMDIWIAPPADSAEMASLGTIYDSVQQTFPDGQIVIITKPERPWFGHAVYGSYYTAHVHPVTAEVLGEYRGSLIRKIVRSLHDSLLVPVHPARVAVNTLSFVVLVMVVTGLITYRRFWKGYLRFSSSEKGTRARHGETHRQIAVWVTPFLIASTLGSAVFFLKDVGWTPVLPEEPPATQREANLPEGFDGAALDRHWAACVEQVPTMKMQVAILPDNPSKPVQFRAYDDDIGQVFGILTCSVDPVSGEVTAETRYSDGNVVAKIENLAIALHYGTWAGWTSLVLWFVAGMASLVLILSGARVYASRIAGADRGPAGWRRGTLPTVIRGLGPWKWLYVLALLVMAAATVL